MPKLIDLSLAVRNTLGRRFLKGFQKPAEQLLAIDRINDHYDRFHQMVVSGARQESVFAAALDVLEIRFAVERGGLDRIPGNGPVVVVANHPFGAVEGLVLGAMLAQVRSDVRILGNYLLSAVVGIRDHVIPVDPFGPKQAASANASGIRRCLSWLRRGGCLVTFPAGEVASWHPRKGRVVEPAWHPHVATLARFSRATVVPVYFPGRNSAFFMLMGLLSPRLRTALLPRELMNRSRQRIALRIGRGIPWQRLKRFPDDKALIDYLRLSTEILNVDPEPAGRPARSAARQNRDRRLKPVIPPVAKQLMQREIERLPRDQRLLESGAFSVWLAQSGQIPHLLDEIGRLREITFRQVQEGTGRALDLDRFDEHYRHLFLWHRPTSELVGGYRLGPVDTILKERGLSGLYSHSLFRFGAEFLDQLPPAIEFGRSFIRPEYQKKFNSLILIWRGIGQFIARCPRYKILFGPVSISRDYEAVSKTLLVHFLKHNNFHDDLARYVAPRQPYRPQGMRLPDESVLRSAGWGIEAISFLISEIEKDGKGVPILLKHYLKLNGKLLSFNVDKAFSDVVDGLLMVDLRETDPKILKRFIGSVELATGIPERPHATFPTPFCGI